MMIMSLLSSSSQHHLNTIFLSVLAIPKTITAVKSQTAQLKQALITMLVTSNKTSKPKNLDV